jgi:predicted hydrolase (HD superfamily)
MLTIAEAQSLVAEHLGTSSRARHSEFVGYAMRRLAEHLGADAVLWEVTGLVHDLDVEATATDRSQHGLVTSQWLANRLPADALTALAAHDHRTGVSDDTPLASALRLADALAVACGDLGPDAAADLLDAPGAVAHLAEGLSNRPYLAALVTENAASLDIPIALLADILRSGPAPA